MKSCVSAPRALGVSAALCLAVLPWSAAVLAAQETGAKKEAGQEAGDGAGQDTQQLDLITIQGNRGYEMAPSEATGGYSIDAATVGTKTPAALRDIPQSVSVVTREAIEDRNLDTLDEMARVTPGMRVLSNDTGRSSVFARGYEYTEFNIDGLPAPLSSEFGTLPSLVAFDRVEIMRGPSGLFNSTSELGGIVNLVRKRPTREFQGHVTARYGSFDQRHLELDLSGPITDGGGVRGRLVAAGDSSDGFVDHNDNDSETLYGTIDADLSADTTLSLAWLHQERDIRVNNGLALGPDGELLDVDRDTFFGAEWNDFNSQSDDLIVDLTHRFDNGGYGRVAMRHSDRSGDYNYAFGFPPTTVSPTGRINAYGIGGDFEQESTSVDASYSQTFGWLGNVSEYVVGADYKRYETDVLSRGAMLGNIDTDDFYDLAYVDVLRSGRTRTNQDRGLEEYGLYSKLTVRPVSRLALIAGARLSTFEVEALDNDSGRTLSREDTEVTPYAGLVLDIGPHHSLYGSYSEVFKPQAVTDADSQNTAAGSGGDLIEPREGTQYEAGIKGSYYAGKLQSRVSVFRLEDENRATSLPTGGNVATGKRVIEGAELELTGSPTSAVDLIAGYTYLDTELVSGTDSRAILNLMPEHMFNAWGEYTVQEGRLAGVRLGAGIEAMDEFQSTSVEAPGYAVVDLMVGYDFTPNLSGKLNFNNVFDKKYYSRVGGPGTFNMYGAPANVVATLRYDF